MQIEKDEVTLRRVIGSKKDQYFLDKKMTTYVCLTFGFFLIDGENLASICGHDWFTVTKGMCTVKRVVFVASC